LVDLCAGSGAIGLSLVTEVQDSEVWAVEQSDEAFEWAKRNNQEVVKREPSVESRYHLVQGDATIPTTLDQLDRSVDAVISNPPYVPLGQIPEQPEVRDYDPEMALYGGSADGTRIPQRIIMSAYSLLRHGGALVMEHDISQGEVLADFAKTHGFCQVRTGNDLTDRSRYLFAVKS
jgi:release factor glutamine methyltransferase